MIKGIDIRSFRGWKNCGCIRHKLWCVCIALMSEWTVVIYLFPPSITLRHLTDPHSRMNHMINQRAAHESALRVHLPFAVVCFSAAGVPLPPDNHTLIVNVASGPPLHSKWTHPSSLSPCGWQHRSASSATLIIHQYPAIWHSLHTVPSSVLWSRLETAFLMSAQWSVNWYFSWHPCGPSLLNLLTPCLINVSEKTGLSNWFTHSKRGKNYVTPKKKHFAMF